MNTLNEIKPPILRRLRGELKLSQRAFADILGLTRTAIANYERDRYPPITTAYRIIDIAAAKGIKITLEDIYPKEELLEKIIPEAH